MYIQDDTKQILLFTWKSLVTSCNILDYANIAKRRLKKSNARNVTKKTTLTLKKSQLSIFNGKKIDSLQTFWISRNISAWRFYDNINPIWENWNNTWNFHFAGKSDN